MKQNKAAYHYEAKHTLVDYLQKWGIPMLGHIDTRAVVKKYPHKGSMTACMTSQESEQAGQSSCTEYRKGNPSYSLMGMV